MRAVPLSRYVIFFSIAAAGLAADLATKALEQSRDSGRGVIAAQCLKILGDVHRHADAFDPQASALHYEQAAELTRSLGMRPLLAHCHLGRGRLFMTMGRPADAREQLETALRLYRDMGMLHWPQEVEAALRELR